MAEAAVAFMMLGVADAAPAQALCPPVQAIQFPPQSDHIDLSGGMPRKDRDCYGFVAKSGQRLTVQVSGTPDDNVVFEVFAPGWRIARSPYGIQVNGATLPGTAEGQDARQFDGTLPASGRYLLFLGSSRGSAGEYHVSVRIR